MGLLESLTSLNREANSLATLRTDEAKLWRKATLATNTRVAATQMARANLASAMEFGLPIEAALTLCDKYSLLDLSDVDYFKRAHSKGRLDVARFPSYLRKATVHTTPVEKLLASTPDYHREDEG